MPFAVVQERRGTELSAFRALAFFFFYHLCNRYSVLVFSSSRVSSGSFESVRVLLPHEVPIFTRRKNELPETALAQPHCEATLPKHAPVL